MNAGDWIDFASFIVAAALAGMAILQFRHSTNEKRKELRWRQAETARAIIQAIREDPYSAAALKMLDWSNVDFVKPGGERTKIIKTDERRSFLRIKDTSFSEPDAEFVRDCFDRLLEDCCLINQFISSELILIEDVHAFFYFYMKKAEQPDEASVLDAFAEAYGYPGFMTFRRRILKRKING